MSTDNAPLAEQSKLMFETSINIDKEVHAKITEIAQKLGITRSRLVAMLLERYAEKEKAPVLSRGTVEYQKSREKEKWRKLHVVLPSFVHDFFDDVRKLWKLSVSFLVALAVEKFLNDMDESAIASFTDNYWHGAHTIIQFRQNGLQYIVCCWGIPEKPPQIPIQ